MLDAQIYVFRNAFTCFGQQSDALVNIFMASYLGPSKSEQDIALYFDIILFTRKISLINIEGFFELERGLVKLFGEIKEFTSQKMDRVDLLWCNILLKNV